MADSLFQKSSGLSPEGYARAAEYQKYFMNKLGLTAEQSAGLLGSILVESDNFKIWNPSGQQTVEGAKWGSQYGLPINHPKSGIGDLQWTYKTRHDDFMNYVEENQKLNPAVKPSDVAMNAGFAVQEMIGTKLGQETLARLKQAQNPENAAKEALWFFRPAGFTESNIEGSHKYGERTANARKIYENLPHDYNNWGGWKGQGQWITAPTLEQTPTSGDYTFKYNVTASPDDPDPFGVGRVIPKVYGSDPEVAPLGQQLASLAAQYPDRQYNTGVSGNTGEPLIYWLDENATYRIAPKVPWEYPDMGPTPQPTGGPQPTSGSLPPEWGAGSGFMGFNALGVPVDMMGNPMPEAFGKYADVRGTPTAAVINGFPTPQQPTGGGGNWQTDPWSTGIQTPQGNQYPPPPPFEPVTSKNPQGPNLLTMLSNPDQPWGYTMNNGTWSLNAPAGATEWADYPIYGGTQATGGATHADIVAVQEKIKAANEAYAKKQADERAAIDASLAASNAARNDPWANPSAGGSVIPTNTGGTNPTIDTNINNLNPTLINNNSSNWNAFSNPWGTFV